MRPVFIQNIGLISAALPSWNIAASILRGERRPETTPLPCLRPDILKSNERRRTTNTIKLAIQATQDLSPDYPLDGDISAVFASSDGDLDIVDCICSALTMPEKPVSPTQFHNSVHNAPAGYWSIGTGFLGAATSIGALNGSFASGLLEAATHAMAHDSSVLLVSYDWPPPDAMSTYFDTKFPFAVAILLSLDGEDALAEIELNTQSSGILSTLTDVSLERLRMGAPAARSLPLLQAVARGSRETIILYYLPALYLAVNITPCS